ncbi:PDC sensor domain-containing protein, partial [Sulfurospirillum arcachonense]|uniref:PDC sensor domain-containing protein n=1 Tax=Sulfurospirillum arcachonense TaxID=57666 RepID=UPI0004682784
MNLQKKITFSIMGGVLIGFIVFLGVNYSMMKGTAEVEVYEKLNSKAHTLSNEIDGWIKEKQNILKGLSEDIKTLDDKSPENIRKYTQLMAKMAKVRSSLIYLKDETVIHINPKVKIPAKTFESRIVYKTAKANNFKPSISKLFPSPIDKTAKVMTISSPIEGESLAALVVGLKSIYKKVLETKIEGGYAVLIGKDRKNIVHPNKKFVNQSMSEIAPSLKWADNKIFSQESGLMEINIGGVDKLMVFDTIPSTGWKVVMTIEKDVAFANLNSQTKKLLLISCGFLVFGSLGIYVLLNFLFKPLQALRSVVTDLGTGDGDLTQRLAVKGKDELADIATSVNLFIK